MAEPRELVERPAARSKRAAPKVQRAEARLTQDVAAEIGRVNSYEPQYREFKIPTGGTGDLLEAFADVQIVSGLIYCMGGLNTDGTPQALAGTLYIGRTPRYLLDSRGPGEESIPYVIAETTLSELQPARVYVRGDAGDRLILVYRK